MTSPPPPSLSSSLGASDSSENPCARPINQRFAVNSFHRHRYNSHFPIRICEPCSVNVSHSIWSLIRIKPIFTVYSPNSIVGVLCGARILCLAGSRVYPPHARLHPFIQNISHFFVEFVFPLLVAPNDESFSIETTALNHITLVHVWHGFGFVYDWFCCCTFAFAHRRKSLRVYAHPVRQCARQRKCVWMPEMGPTSRLIIPSSVEKKNEKRKRSMALVAEHGPSVRHINYIFFHHLQDPTMTANEFENS